MINNKGQALVAFILIIPLFIIIFALVIDFGNISLEKRKITNDIKYILKYELDSNSANIEEDIKSYFTNVDYTSDILALDVSLDDNQIIISISVKTNLVFDILNNKTINLSYSGYMVNDKFIFSER